ncbi:MAG: winged helix-turn-helix transcriptional regulator [Candidatus Binataceae bacterium]
MRRKTFAHMNCSIARALEQIGEWWTFLIIREAFMGTRRFDQFQRHLGIARNILAVRLKKLVGREILERAADASDGRRVEYRLTTKGRALFPLMMALREWGDRWVVGPERAPVLVLDRLAREPIATRVTSGDGRELGPADVIAVPGPGAAAATRARLHRGRYDAPGSATSGAVGKRVTQAGVALVMETWRTAGIVNQRSSDENRRDRAHQSHAVARPHSG